jgi:integrase
MPEIVPTRQRRARRQRLTDVGVSKLPRRSTPYFHPDPLLVGHGIRVRPTGPGAYTVIVRDPYKRQRWVKIGSTDAMKIAEARDIARAVIRRVEQGLAPFPEAPTKPDSVEAVAEGWLKRHVQKRGLRTSREIERVLKKYILPHLGSRSFVELKRRDIAQLLDYIEDRFGAHTADAALAHLRSMATWLQGRDDGYTPPFTKGMRRVPKQARARSRTLNDAELRAVWHAAGDAGAFGSLVRLLLLSGQRLAKVVTMKWGDIAPDGTWTIRTAPREKGNPGSLVLPESALAIMRAQPHIAGNPHIFAGNGAGRKVFSQSYKVGLDRASGVSGWKLHDLRRSARSLMSRAGVRPDIAERVLGHAVGNIQATYDRHSYDSEVADALRRLAALIERIVNPPEGDNVVVVLHEAAVAS